MKENRLYRFLRSMAIVVFAIIFPTKVTGVEHIPADGAVMLCCNHVSGIDPIFLACALKRRVTYLAKKELFANKFMNWLLRSIGMVPVDRGASDIQAMRVCLDVLKQGGVLGIFPQGHRYKQDENRTMQNGAAMMALRARPVVIAAHISAPVKLFRRTIIRISPPLDLSDIARVNAAGLQSATERIAGAIWQEEQ